MGNIVAKFDIDKLFAGVYEAVDIITATVVDAMQMACLEVTRNAKLEHLQRPDAPITFFDWFCYL